jgi:hypothetical protein
MSDLDDFARTCAADNGLVVLATVRSNGTAQASVVNAGVLEHPVTGARVIGLVAAGGSRKLINLRRRAHGTVVAKAGWQWVGAEGHADLWGPDDPLAGRGAEDLRLTLRAVFAAAGGVHDDWDAYDRVMAEERRVAVFITPGRVYSPGG